MNGDTVLCFSLPQAQELAQRLVHGAYADSLTKELELANDRLSLTLEAKGQLVHRLHKHIAWSEQVVTHHRQRMQSMKGHLSRQERTLKRIKKQRKWMAVGLAGLIAWSFIH